MSATDSHSTSVSYLITLRTTDAKEPSLLNRRLISLHPGETTILGRLSKNHKMEYIAKSTNGYFDNPIISRCHAVLENRSGYVYISDKSSTHGTFLNGTKLTPEYPIKIENGDKIRLGSPVETATIPEHLPTELEISLLAMQGSLPIATSASQKEVYEPPQTKATGTNSFHAPDEDSDEDVDEGASRNTWKPFAPHPILSSVELVNEFPRPGELLAEPDNQMTGGLSSPLDFRNRSKAAIEALLLEGNPWVLAEPVHDCYDVDECDEDAYFSGEEEEEDELSELSELSDIDYPSEYDSENQDALPRVPENETSKVNGGESQIPETQVMNQTIVTEKFAADTLVVHPSSRMLSDMQAEGVKDEEEQDITWKYVKEYLHAEGLDTLSEDDSDYNEYSSLEDEEEYYEDSEMEEEEEYEDQDYELDYGSCSMDEDGYQDEQTSESEDLPSSAAAVAKELEEVITMIPETQVQQAQQPTTPKVLAETVPEPQTPTSRTSIPSTESLLESPPPTIPSAQTQTPPITPEHIPSKKRPHPEDTTTIPTTLAAVSEPVDISVPLPTVTSSPVEDTPRKIAPLPSRAVPSRVESDFSRLDEKIDFLTQQNILLDSQNADLEKSVKRRKTEAGWVDVAKTMGKYTVAGVIGGIATVVGLAWSASG